MNLTSRKARRNLIALGSTGAVIAAGISFVATAYASPSPLTLIGVPSSNSIAITNLDPNSAGATAGVTAANAATVAFGVKIGALANGTDSLDMQVVSGPVGGSLDVKRVAANGAAPSGAASYSVASVPVAPAQSVTVLNATPLASDIVYLAAPAASAGTYTVRFFQDTGGNAAYDPNDDPASPVLTVRVYDVTNTAVAANVMTPTLTVPSSVEMGQPITATVGLPLTMSDARGVNPGTGNSVLGSALVANVSTLLSNVGVGARGGIAQGTTLGSLTPTSTGLTGATAATSAAAAAGAAVTTTFQVGTSTTATAVANTVVTDNGATAITDVAATAVTGSVLAPANAATILPGTSTVTYSSSVTDAGVKTDDKVYFTLTPGTNTPTLTATGGTLVSNTNGTMLYYAMPDSTGLASLTVSSGTTTNGTTYTVRTASNAQQGALLTATYATAVPSTVTVTNATSSLYPTVGNSVTLTGKITDQFGNTIQPSGTYPSQAQVFIGAQPVNGAATTTATANVAVSGGLFSYGYTPATTPTAGSQTAFGFAYDKDNSTTIQVNGGATNELVSSNINWTSASPATGVSITTPASAAAFAPPVSIAGNTVVGAGYQISGTVTDATNAAMPFKSVTLTGGPGTYFSATNAAGATDQLVTSLTVAANGSGVYTAYGYFTHAGTPTVTVTAGTGVSTTLTAAAANAAQAAQAYKVTVAGASGAPGDTMQISGTVTDAFGNPVPGVVNLSIGTSTLGALGTGQVTAGANGIFTTTFVALSNAPDGTATLTATLNGQNANAAPHASWATAGQTIAAGTYQATSAIAVAAPKADTIILSGPASKTGAGWVWLTGSTTAGKTVKFYSKRAGSSDPYGFIGTTTADVEGGYSMKVLVNASTTYITSINSDGVYSNAVTTTLVVPQPVLRSTISMKATAIGGGKVRIYINGGPTGKGLIHLYKKSGGRWVYVGTYRGNSAGDATPTIKVGAGTWIFAADYTAPGRAIASVGLRVRVR